MKLSALIELEKIIVEEVVRRRKLGGYSQDADGILLISEVVMKILNHIIDEAAPELIIESPAKKKTKI